MPHGRVITINVIVVIILAFTANAKTIFYQVKNISKKLLFGSFCIFINNQIIENKPEPMNLNFLSGRMEGDGDMEMMY